ncbi:MAG: outer membrane lipid asymmetry maintenance protein MlaD [Desulfobulbaceae bacterium]|nr:outer membrane lipid asymmetry maintenance protein MlaD [Desulfobulbaceae bacterium]HIJ79621.1 outer membrane lipid asymmetry maintenance protein MlaD [Deltaproteobacteria bacterium]
MKKINFDLLVGVFVVLGFMSFVYISLQLGEFSVFSMENVYSVQADFDNVSGLKRGALVEMSGVSIGKVEAIRLAEGDRARVSMQLNSGIKITDDAIASVKTQGIIGDKYIKITQGGSDDMLTDGDVISETESAVDIEDLVSKYIFGDV